MRLLVSSLSANSNEALNFVRAAQGAGCVDGVRIFAVPDEEAPGRKVQLWRERWLNALCSSDGVLLLFSEQYKTQMLRGLGGQGSATAQPLCFEAESILARHFTMPHFRIFVFWRLCFDA